MRIHYLQHVPFEEPGSIAQWAEASGHKMTCSKLFESVIMPDLREIDLLVIMGGPMSVNDEHEFPWLVPEKKFIREAIESGKSVLGICLGAQLIACAMGSRIYRNKEKEIGWFPVQGVLPLQEVLPLQAVPAEGNPYFKFPSSTRVFHWHGETFDLPEEAVLLASSKACKNQAFQLCKSVIGLQFHLETTPESARDIVTNCRDELIPSKYIQTEEEILSSKPEDYKTINQLMGKILSYLTEKITSKSLSPNIK